MDKDVRIFENVRPNIALVQEAFSFDPNRLESTSDVVISKYCIALSQYLIYMTSQSNMDKVLIHKKKVYVDGTVELVLNKDLVKELGTKTAAANFIIGSNEMLSKAQNSIEELRMELMCVDGIEKAVGELIASFKRELTRREKELYSTRAERR